MLITTQQRRHHLQNDRLSITLNEQSLQQVNQQKDTDENVLAVLKGKMGMQPPVQRQQIERRHCLGRKGDGNGPHRPRTVVVRFASERLRDDVYRARTILKTHKKLGFHLRGNMRYPAKMKTRVNGQG